MSSDYQEYPDVVQEVRGALNPGRLKLQSNNVQFKNIKTGKVDQFQDSDIDKVAWLKRAKGFCLKLTLHNGHIHRYDGFKEPDQEKLSTFVSKNYNIKLEKVDLSVKGWNWGQVKFEGNGLNFMNDNNLMFEVPMNNVSKSIPSKNEITLEFHQNDDAAVSLMEMRLHVPPDPNNLEQDTVQEFNSRVMENADIIQATGDAVCVFPEVQCLTPRGRYDIKIYTTFLQLHGKTFDYKVPYTSVLRLFLLPHKDGRQFFFVVSLDPPIKQGQTRYHMLILLFYKDSEINLECGLGDELEERYDGKLQKEMNGLEYEIISKVFKAVTSRKITVPGNFSGHSGTPAISCSYKAATGLLYPLERGFIFVHKPPVHIRFDELAAVNFARSVGTSKSFDFDVETKAGNVYTFSSIEKDEYWKLFEFAKNKKLRMKNIGGKKMGEKDYDNMMDSDAEDDTHDAYLERMKAEGKDRDSDAMDDDSDSSDEDFKPEDSGSDVAEEYNSNPPTTSDDSDEDGSANSPGGSGSDAERRREEREKRKKEKKERKAKTAKTVKEPGTRKQKKKKADKDPDKPKRPPTAYFMFFMEQRETIKSENPSFSVVDISKKGGELWKELSTEEKEEYHKKSKAAKEKYDEAIKEYEKKLREEGRSEETSPKEKKKKKSKSSSSSPKKAVTDTKAGSGGSYKSKEFISDSESSSDEDEDDKPLKKLKKDKSSKKKSKKEEKEKMEVDESGSESDEEKPAGVKRRSQRKEGEESDVGSLPDEEEILSSPEHSGRSAAGSDADSESSAASDAGDEEEEEN